MLKSAVQGRYRSPQKVSRIAGHLVGSVVGFRNGVPLVTYPGNVGAALPARSTVEIPVPHGESSALPVLLVFEEEDATRPVVVGLLAAPSPPPSAARALTASVDGKRVVLEADDEIELRCGKASIILRRNGRVVIRGTYVETRSEGVNRIRGGSVQIN